MEVSLGLEITQDIVPTHLSMMRKFARKFNDKSTSDFVVKCQVSFDRQGEWWQLRNFSVGQVNFIGVCFPMNIYQEDSQTNFNGPDSRCLTDVKKYFWICSLGSKNPMTFIIWQWCIFLQKIKHFRNKFSI